MSGFYVVGGLAPGAVADRTRTKMLAEVVFGARGGVPRAELDERVRWFGIAPTEEEEELIARGETVTFLVGE